MFIVTIENDGVTTEIHGESEKLKSGKVVKGINAIDTFTFSLLPSNAGFGAVHDFTTLVKVYNTNKDRYEFYGRVLYSDTSMSESGLISQDVTCESYFGFLCDSLQNYATTQNWTVSGLLQHIIDVHNSQTEDYKHFVIGAVDVIDPNDNLYCGIQRENTWDTIKDKLIDVLGGELCFRVVDGVIYLDYLQKLGKTSETAIEVSRNMKSIKQEKDPSDYITRLVPLGMKIGEEDERLGIEDVNDGKSYVEDTAAVEQYGIHYGVQEWDDVSDENNLLTKARAWLAENNKLKVKYSITALDLSLLGLDIDDFDVCNFHPIVNPLLGIDDTARITKKTVDVCEEVKSTIEVGENFKTATDIQIEQQQEAKKQYSKITKSNAELKIEVTDEIKEVQSSFEAYVDSLILSVENNADGTACSIKLKATEDGSEIELSSANINLSGLVTFAGLADGTTEIDGGCIKTGTIDAERLNLSGAITWGDLSSDVKSTIYAQATDLPSYIKNTYIDATSVESFRIVGQSVTAETQLGTTDDESGELLGFVLRSEYGSGYLNYMQIYARDNEGGSPHTIFGSPNGCYALWKFDKTEFTESVHFYGDVQFTGEIDFKYANMRVDYGSSLPSSGSDGQLFFLLDS